MEKQNYLFEATNTVMNQQTLWFGLLSLALLLFLLWYSKKEVSKEFKNHKQLLLMLGGFVLLIALSGTFFSWWATQKIKDVTIVGDRITTPYGETSIDNIRRVYFQEDFIKPRFSTNIATDTIKFLILEEYNKKTHALSDENYDVQQIYKVFSKLKE